MNLKKQLALLLLLLSVGVFGQKKVFSFSEIQSRNSVQQWGKAENVGNQQISFTSEKIDVKIDKPYHLKIVSKTDLPDNGIIYLCNDEKANPVTVMLIDNSKMFFYSKSNRYLINFDQMKISNVLADTD